MRTRIHVNQFAIRKNIKLKRKAPVFRVIQKGKSHPAKKVVINGPSEIVYSPDKPLSCGARVWIETESEVYFK